MPNQPLKYRNFDIEITDLDANQQFKVRTIGNTPGGEMLTGQAGVHLYEPNDFNKLLNLLDRRRLNKDQMIELGEKLGKLILTGRLLDLYEKSLLALENDEGLRLRLRIEPLVLSALPWEYLYLQKTAGERNINDFLALNRKVSIVRYETTGAPVKPLEGLQKVNVLVAMAAPTDQPDLDLTPDRAAINDAFNELNTKGQVLEHTFIDNSTREQLLNTVNGSDIFHFIGHGEFQEADVDEAGNWLKKGQIVLEKEDGKSDRYPSDLLANTLDNAGVRLVVLGACNSASRDQGGAWTGVAPALVREDIPAVLAMQYKVQQKSAQAFMRSFYALALAGYSIDEAMFLGRQAILNEHGIENRDWGVPVIYLRAEDGVIFPFSSVVTPEIVSKMYAEQYFDNVNRSTVIGNLDESDGSSEMESHQKANTITDTVLTGNKRTGKPSSGESKSTTDLGSVSRSKVIGEEHQVL